MATPAKPEEQFTVIGDDAPFIRVLLGDSQPFKRIEAEPGSMAVKTADIDIEVAFEGGLDEALQRLVTGEAPTVNIYTCKPGKSGAIFFASPNPGPVKRLDILPGKPWWVQHDGFICGANVKVEARRVKDFWASILGGEGFFMQYISTEGTEPGIAFIDGGGSHLEMPLVDGEIVRVDTGLIMAYEDTVKPGVDFVIDPSVNLKELFKNIKEAALGGEGLVHATLKGPGKVYIESLPLARRRGRMQGVSTEGSGINIQDALKSILPKILGHQK